MGPVNMYVGTQDPLLNSSRDLDEQLRIAEQRLAALQEMNKTRMEVQQHDKSSIWDEIDKEIEPLSQEDRMKLQSNKEYAAIYTQLNTLVQSALVDLVRGTVEQSEEGRKLLESQLKLVKELKGKIMEDSRREMELFRRFKEYSTSNPEATYDDFLKTL